MEIQLKEQEKILHKKFVELGNNRRKFTNQLLALLPEIYERKIYKKYAATIVEYAGKFGGLSKGVALKRLRLERFLKDKPKLRGMIATEGVHKIDMIARLTTAENENFWADKVENMSKVSLQELSKEVRNKMENGVGANMAVGYAQSLCKAVPLKISIDLDEEMTGMFLKLKEKFGKHLSNKEVMKKILKITEGTIIGGASSVKVLPEESFEGGEETRYIKVRQQKIIQQKSNNQCEYPGCNRAGQVYHHKNRFAESHNHKSVIRLCKIHHEFMHNGLVKNEQMETREWRLDLNEKELQKIDQLYRKYRLAGNR